MEYTRVVVSSSTYSVVTVLVRQVGEEEGIHTSLTWSVRGSPVEKGLHSACI